MTKILYHEDFAAHYALDPAADPGRLEPALKLLQNNYSFEIPGPARKEQVLLVHSERHYHTIAADSLLLHTALLSAGAAIEAAKTAVSKEYAFALCRPPGHHASPGSCWGFCYFNNIAIAVKEALRGGQADSALIVDFDLHYGDGTANTFAGVQEVSFWHSQETNRLRYLDQLRTDLESLDADIVAVSAGFDRGIDDWGGILTADDYREIGILLAGFARQKCKNRLFAVLEGGYNHQALAKNIDAFLTGLQIPGHG